MLIVMKADATEGQVEAVVRVIEELGFRAHPMPGASRTAIGIIPTFGGTQRLPRNVGRKAAWT